MGRVYFKKSGFVGLSMQGKLIDIGISFVGFVIACFVFGAVRNNVVNYAGVSLAVISSVVVGWIAQFFLPRDRYYKDEYYCSDCGQYFGYSPRVCEKCGCNRYTTEDSGVGTTVRTRRR